MGRFVLLLWLAACAGPPDVSAPAYGEVQGKGLGTTWVVRWAERQGVEAADVEAVVLDALRDVDEGMSTWRDDSDLAAVRRGPGPVAVRPGTADVVRAALALADDTRGAFDPTVQPLMELWGLHGTERTTWPTDEELAAARAQVGFQRVRVAQTPEGGPAVDAGGAALDLSAIAKGHAVDRVGFALAGLGLGSWFVEVGGEVRTAGESPRGGPWVVGIDRPDPATPSGKGLIATVALGNAALATSGNYRTAYELQGRRVHHTLDPRTGLPATSEVLSASVVAPDCQTADGWATALMVLGPDEGLPLIEARPTLAAWMVVRTEEGVAIRASRRMETWLLSTHLEAFGLLE